MMIERFARQASRKAPPAGGLFRACFRFFGSAIIAQWHTAHRQYAACRPQLGGASSGAERGAVSFGQTSFEVNHPSYLPSFGYLLPLKEDEENQALAVAVEIRNRKQVLNAPARPMNIGAHDASRTVGIDSRNPPISDIDTWTEIEHGMERHWLSSALPAGTRLREFEIIAPIGRGGFGFVYLARDRSLERDVAIKEFFPVAYATRVAGHVTVSHNRNVFDEGMRHFICEAHILAGLRHSVLPEILQFFEESGTAYIVMPHYRGNTLHDMIRDGYRAKTTDELLAFISPLLFALDELHCAGCYHLDVSSDNILIQEDGTPVLLDFGSAKLEMAPAPPSPSVMYKPGFTPIEQFGMSETGPWSDIYSISAVAYNAVTGKVPEMSFNRTKQDLLESLTHFASDALPRKVLAVFESGLKVRALERPQSVREVITALEQALGEESRDAGPAVSRRPPDRLSFFRRPVCDKAAPRIDGFGTLGQPSFPFLQGWDKASMVFIGVLVISIFVIATFVIKG
jgi:serine/threonine protein kinase